MSKGKSSILRLFECEEKPRGKEQGGARLEKVTWENGSSASSVNELIAWKPNKLTKNDYLHNNEKHEVRETKHNKTDNPG